MSMDEQQASSDLGRALAALRRRVTQTCPVCKKPYEGAAHKRYCSAACRQQAYRLRHQHTPDDHTEARL
jgi:hypothetical protein